MIAPTNLFELQKLKKEYMNLSSFIRSLYIHTDFEKTANMGQIQAELYILRQRLDIITTKMDAFEQNELGYK